MRALSPSVRRRQGAVRAEEAGSPHAPAAPAVLRLNRAAPGEAAHSPAPPCRRWEVRGARGDPPPPPGGRGRGCREGVGRVPAAVRAGPGPAGAAASTCPQPRGRAACLAGCQPGCGGHRSGARPAASCGAAQAAPGALFASPGPAGLGVSASGCRTLPRWTRGGCSRIQRVVEAASVYLFFLKRVWKRGVR